MLSKNKIDSVIYFKGLGLTHRDIAARVSCSAGTVHYVLERNKKLITKKDGPRILVFDIETAPNVAYTWGMWQQNVGLSQFLSHWYVLSWSAKWVGEDDILYEDKRASWGTQDDSLVLSGMWDLLDEADIVVTQNGKKFDVKKLNARFVQNGFQPPSSYKHIDTLQIAKRHFGFTSNKLEYMTDKLCKKYKKLKHGKFPGMLLWTECLKGNLEAWDEMEEYNKYDVLSLEELMYVLAPWSNQMPNLDMYYDDHDNHCLCGSTEFLEDGYAYTNISKFARLKCVNCGAEKRSKVNLLSKEKRATLKMNVT